MAFTNTPFVDGNAITESDLKGRIGNFETWLNGGSVAGDLSHGEWVTKGHVLRPEFIGGSDDRAEFCTGTTRYRVHTPDKVGAEIFHAEARGGGSGSGLNNWEPVNGLNVTIKVYRPMTVIYTASWLAWETGNTALNQCNASNVLETEFLNNPNYVAADFALYSQKIDGTTASLTQYAATRRRLFSSVKLTNDKQNTDITGWSKSAGKQMSTHHVFDLTAGIYNVGIRCNPQNGGGSSPFATADGVNSQNIFVRARSCVVDAHFNAAT
jgi:hypothetical protein